VIHSPPLSGLVIWVGYTPSANSIVQQDITSSAVTVVAGSGAGLELCPPGGGTASVVAHGSLGPLSPGKRTTPVSTGMQKVARTTSRSEYVETRISFQAVALPGRPLPPGAGAIPHQYAVSVTIT